jgi:DHA2 family multidrug resistance protein
MRFSFALGHLNLDIAPIDVIWPNIINGLAMGFIFVPLTTSAMGQLRNEQMPNATGICNLLRNIGAAAGIAMMTTFLARGAQVHQNYLAAHVTPYDAAYPQETSAVQSALSPYAGTYEAGRMTEAIVGMQVSRQSALMAYVDDFRLLAFMAVACIPGVLLFRPVRHKDAPRRP